MLNIDECIGCFLQCIRQNNVRQAGRMLSTSTMETGTATANSDPTCLCHPLCTCAKCRPIVGAQERDMERSQATVNSRDERGFTGQLGALYGHSVYWLWPNVQVNGVAWFMVLYVDIFANCFVLHWLCKSVKHHLRIRRCVKLSIIQC